MDRSSSSPRESRQQINNCIEPCFNALKQFFNELDDEETSELSEYLRSFMANEYKNSLPPISTEKAKLIFRMFSRSTSDDAAHKILSYLEAATYGWHGDRYRLNNHCLTHRPTDHCRQKFNIDQPELAEDLFFTINSLFFHKEYGVYALYIFSYCLAALFSSKLGQDRFRLPFYLQIACERNSVLYHMIQEIVAICDVNEGVFEQCNAPSHHNGYCGYRHKTYYPTQSTEKDLEDLISNRDVPVIIDGHENERYYLALLRKVANVPNHRNALGLQDRFQILPIFLCTTIQSSFGNVFHMDLSDLQVSSEYLALLKSNRQILASWVLELVKDFAKYLFPESVVPQKKTGPSFATEIGNCANYIRTMHTGLTADNAANVGFLSFFFKGTLRVFERSFTFPLDTQFPLSSHGNETPPIYGEQIIGSFVRQAERALADLHQRYLPAPSSMGINDKEAQRLAKKIENKYRAHKAYIRVTPTQANEERYSLNVDTLQGTRVEDLNRYRDTVQIKLGYETFRVDLSDPTKITIIASKTSLKENSLMAILNDPQFTNSKMKLPYAIGYDDLGAMHIEDIAEFPHLLLGGSTQSGKSTALICLLLSIIYKHRTGDVNILLMDLLGKYPSQFEPFSNHPTLACPVIQDHDMAYHAILKLREEMDSRLKNKNLNAMPRIVCVIDEFPRLFSDMIDRNRRGQLTVAITNLLNRGRHAKIHMVLVAQDPTKKNMVCGVANLDAKIAFRCSRYQNSVAILGRGGAQELIGKGRMIFDSPAEMDKRLQGAYIGEGEIKKQLSEIPFTQENKYPFKLDEAALSPTPNAATEHISDRVADPPDNFVENLAKVVVLLLDQGQISNLAVQQQLEVGYRTANKYLKMLEGFGLIPPLKHKRKARKLNAEDAIKVAEVTEFMESQGFTWGALPKDLHP